MGDRVLMQCYSSKSGETGPVVYCHWNGSEAGVIVRRLAKRMESRGADLHYASARLVQDAINGDEGNVSFGVWNRADLLTEGDSHGDAGVILIDVDNGYKTTCLGGYMITGDDGFPVDKWSTEPDDDEDTESYGGTA